MDGNARGSHAWRIGSAVKLEAELAEDGSRANGMKDDSSRCHKLLRVDAHVSSSVRKR